jgi:hypothetical protein
MEVYVYYQILRQKRSKASRHVYFQNVHSQHVRGSNRGVGTPVRRLQPLLRLRENEVGQQKQIKAKRLDKHA